MRLETLKELIEHLEWSTDRAEDPEWCVLSMTDEDATALLPDLVRAHEAITEVRSALEQLDHLAEVWGDEGVFRTCRDRLRALLPEGK